jgi:transketolase
MDTNEIVAQRIRKTIIQQSKRAGTGHIGSCLSVADILAVLYNSVLNISSPTDPNRDRFILSKGHAALALYAALHTKRWLSKELLGTYLQEHTLLGVHPERNLPGIDFSTGSLGMGVSYATGAALAARMQNSSRRVFVLVSDAECNEGVTWESAMLAGHHKLSNLYLIVDLNGQQAMGYTKDILNMAPLSQKWEVFGWDVHEVDGHNSDEIVNTIQSCGKISNQPHAIIAHTTFGKGVSFMENQIKWHYLPMSDAEYQEAIREVSHESWEATTDTL